MGSEMCIRDSLKTDHKNLTYINVTLTGKVLRWKLYLQDKDFHLMHVPGKEVHQFVPDALSRLCENNMPPKALAREVSSAMKPSFHIPSKIFNVLSEVHSTKVGHHGRHMCKKRLKDKGHAITDRMITQFTRQCPCCQVMNRLRIPIYMRFLQPLRGDPFGSHWTTQDGRQRSPIHSRVASR